MAARLKKKNKPGAEQEPRSAHGRAVNKPRVEQEPRSAHGRAVKKNKENKPGAEQEPRSAHGRAVKNKKLKQLITALFLTHQFALIKHYAISEGINGKSVIQRSHFLITSRYTLNYICQNKLNFVRNKLNHA